MPWWGTQLNLYKSFNPGRFFLFPTLVPVIIWSTFWKGLALYRAARNGQKGWFVVLLVVNTVGILEIIYLLFFSTPKLKSTKKK